MRCHQIRGALLLLAAVSGPLVHGKPADTVFHNGSIYTLNAASTKVQSIAIADGYITYVGPDAKPFIGPNTTVVDLKGRMAMPGLVDAHMHVISGGLFLLKCNLNYQPLDLSGVLKHIQGCIDAEPEKESPSSWLEVVNMDYPDLNVKSGAVTKANLDSLKTKRPVIVRSFDYHTVWCNSRALQLSNITSATPDPANGKIEHLPGTGEPSGILEDTAYSILAGPEPPTAQDNIDALEGALRLFREAGITAFQDAAATPSFGPTFDAVKKQGRLSARAWLDYRIEGPTSAAEIPAIVQDVLNITAQFHDKSKLAPKPTQKWQAIKGFLDGVITYPAATGAVIAPYFQPAAGSNKSAAATSWAPDNATWPKTYWKPELMNVLLEQLLLRGIDAQFHADGDLAVRVALDAVAYFRSRHPDHAGYRVGIAHDELSHPDDWGRFAELGVDAIMSFQWAQMSASWIPDTFNALGPERTHYLEAWGEIAKRGRPIVYGSDWPIDPLDEWLALKTGVTRHGDQTNPNSPESQGAPFNETTLPGLSLTREQALRAITVESSRFLRANDSIGSLEVGKLADLIVLERNYFEVPEAEIARQKVLLTMLGGEVVYVADGQDFGVKAKFANDEKSGLRLERKTVGGFAGRHLDHVGKKAVQKLRRRETCGHGHHH